MSTRYRRVNLRTGKRYGYSSTPYVKVVKRGGRSNAKSGAIRKIVSYNRPNQVYRFKRWAEYVPMYHSEAGGGIASNTSGNIEAIAGQTEYKFAMNFTLASLPNYTEFTSLFRYYRIRAVKIFFKPHTDNTLYAPNAEDGVRNINKFTEAIGERFICFDDRDEDLFTYNEIKQNENTKMKPSNRMFTYYCRPRATTMIDADQNVSTATAWAQTGRPWISTNNYDVRYIGVKGVFRLPDPGSGNANITFYKVSVRYYFEFKGLR